MQTFVGNAKEDFEDSLSCSTLEQQFAHVHSGSQSTSI